MDVAKGKEKEWRGLTVPFIIGKKMKITESLIKSMIEEHITGSENFLVQMTVSTSGQISVLMDGDNGFTIADCVSLSRHIEHQIDRDENDFSLEVSSYGVGNPLLLPRQYRKNIGRLLDVTLTDGQQLIGRIISADEQGVDVEIQQAKKSRSPKPAETVSGRWLYNEIEKAVIKIEF